MQHKKEGNGYNKLIESYMLTDDTAELLDAILKNNNDVLDQIETADIAGAIQWFISTGEITTSHYQTLITGVLSRKTMHYKNDVGGLYEPSMSHMLRAMLHINKAFSLEKRSYLKSDLNNPEVAKQLFYGYFLHYYQYIDPTKVRNSKHMMFLLTYFIAAGAEEEVCYYYAQNYTLFSLAQHDLIVREFMQRSQKQDNKNYIAYIFLCSFANQSLPKIDENNQYIFSNILQNIVTTTDLIFQFNNDDIKTIVSNFKEIDLSLIIKQITQKEKFDIVRYLLNDDNITKNLGPFLLYVAMDALRSSKNPKELADRYESLKNIPSLKSRMSKHNNYYQRKVLCEYRQNRVIGLIQDNNTTYKKDDIQKVAHSRYGVVDEQLAKHDWEILVENVIKLTAKLEKKAQNVTLDEKNTYGKTYKGTYKERYNHYCEQYSSENYRGATYNFK